MTDSPKVFLVRAAKHGEDEEILAIEKDAKGLLSGIIGGLR